MTNVFHRTVTICLSPLLYYLLSRPQFYCICTTEHDVKGCLFAFIHSAQLFVGVFVFVLCKQSWVEPVKEATQVNVHAHLNVHWMAHLVRHALLIASPSLGWLEQTVVASHPFIDLLVVYSRKHSLWCKMFYIGHNWHVSKETDSTKSIIGLWRTATMNWVVWGGCLRKIAGKTSNQRFWVKTVPAECCKELLCTIPKGVSSVLLHCNQMQFISLKRKNAFRIAFWYYIMYILYVWI